MNDDKFALIIDNSVSIRQHVKSILRDNEDVGDIIEAENPDDALKLLLKHDGTLQFIVSDWDLPGTPLAEFLRILQFHPRLAGAPLLLMIDEDSLQAKAVAKEVGATAILTTPPDPERLLVLSMAVTGTVDRRRAKRIKPFVECEIDLGFSKTKKTYAAEIVNISDTGILLRTPVPSNGTGYVYDVANVSLRPAKGDSIKVSAKILRIEADSKNRDTGKKVLMAFEYEKLDDNVRKSLRQYLQLNDPATDAAATN
jgi:two-component system, chemotaxis family, chemotaxis protein CheY